jgi:hypothetical protein
MKKQNAGRRLPDFLCIGAQRSGTTWLYENLGAHIQVWLPPIKEIHYFNSREKPLKRKLNVYFRHLRARILDDLRDKRPFSQFSWDLHYFFGIRNDDWYQGLFRPAVGQIAGEITPDYAILDLETIKHVRGLNPHMKLIYLMRDPIDRSWSSAAKDLAREKRRHLEDVPEGELLAKLNGPGPTARSNHLQVLGNWESVFGPRQVFVGFFDDIIATPSELLGRIHQFLEIAYSPEHIPANIDTKVNSAGIYKSTIPPRYELLLAVQQIGQLRALSERFGGHATQWLKRAQSILDSAGGKGA